MHHRNSMCYHQLTQQHFSHYIVPDSMRHFGIRIHLHWTANYLYHFHYNNLDRNTVQILTEAQLIEEQNVILTL